MTIGVLKSSQSAVVLAVENRCFFKIEDNAYFPGEEKSPQLSSLKRFELSPEMAMQRTTIELVSCFFAVAINVSCLRVSVYCFLRKVLWAYSRVT